MFLSTVSLCPPCLPRIFSFLHHQRLPLCHVVTQERTAASAPVRNHARADTLPGQDLSCPILYSQLEKEVVETPIEKRKHQARASITCYKMAAASSRPPSPDVPVAAAGAAASASVLALLTSVTTVFAAAWSEQQSDADDGDDNAATLALASDPSATECGKRLRADLVAAAALNDVKDAGVASAILRSCVKIGQDVVLRLDRLEKSTGEMAAWNLIDLVVLAERLDALIQRARDLEAASL